MIAALLFFLVVTSLVWRIPLFRSKPFPPLTAVTLWLVKASFGIALWAVYTFYYTDRINSDIYKYFDDALVLEQARIHGNGEAWAAVMLGQPAATADSLVGQLKNWERNFNKAVPVNENQLMIRIHALLLPLTKGNIHLHLLLFSFLSFIGIWLLVLAFLSIAAEINWRYALAPVLFPSLLFWTGGGLKEAFLLLGFGLLLFGLFQRKQPLLLSVLMGISGFILIAVFRYYLALCLTAPILGVLYSRSQLPAIPIPRISSTASCFLTANLMALIILMAIAPMDRKLNFPRVMARKQQHAIAEAQYMKAGSYCDVPKIDSTFPSVIIHLPQGLYYTYTRPSMGQSKNPVMLLSALENTAVFLALIGALAWWFRNKKQQSFSNEERSALFFALNVILLYGALIGLTTPVMGNLVRYKVFLLPMTAWIIILMTKKWHQAGG
ncbi:MAG: hypothetical protein U0T84_07375 [Chitinophagales bacterium]